MRKTVSGIMLTLLFIGISMVFNITLVSAEEPFIRDLTVQMTPEFPQIHDEVNVTVSFWILEAYHGVDFGNLTQVGNTFSVDINVSAIGLPIVGPWIYEHSYILGKLSLGSYSFSAYVYMYLDGTRILLTSTTKFFTVTLPPAPDINNDGIVDIHDIIIWANAFGSQLGDPNWDPQADLYQDNIIDIFDGIIISINFGKTYP